ncbi:hypothetical protein V2J09_013508 [Rumex salicifolius]
MKATVIGCCLTTPAPALFSPFNRFEIPANSASNAVEASPFTTELVVASSTSDKVSYVQSYGRRKLLFAATSIPFLVPMQENGRDFNAVAEELVSPIYLLMKEEIRKAVSKGKAAGVLRLALLKPEIIQILQKAKTVVDETQSVSWADMISVAGSEAVSICGGPSITVKLGRLDSMVPDPEGKLPEETLDASGLKEAFQRKGFSTQELIALSGAHTLGSKGFGSPTTFDNSYYKILLEKPWLSPASMSSMVGLPSDRALVDDGECLRWIKKYADDQETFFHDFSSAFIKLVNSGAKWRNL